MDMPPFYKVVISCVLTFKSAHEKVQKKNTVVLGQFYTNVNITLLSYNF